MKKASNFDFDFVMKKALHFLNVLRESQFSKIIKISSLTIDNFIF